MNTISHNLIESHIKLLRKSDIDISFIYDKMSKDPLFCITLDDLLSLIRSEILSVQYRWNNYCLDYKTKLFPNLILNAKIIDKDIEYIYLCDSAEFVGKSLKRIDAANKGTILVFQDADGIISEYRVCLPEQSFTPVIEKLSKPRPQEYTVSELLSNILRCLSPVLEFEHETTELTESVKESILCYLPGNNHRGIGNKEESIIENWEYCLNCDKNWKFNSDSVQQIITCIISGLEDFYDHTNASWNQVINDCIVGLRHQ